MQQLSARLVAFAASLIFAALMAGGCLLSASEGAAEPTAIPQLLPSLTPTPTETHTPGPTPEPEFIVVTNTPDPNELAQLTAIAQVVEATIDPIILEVTLTVAAATGIPLTQTAQAEIDFQLPTLSPTLDPTFAVFPTFTPTFQTGGTGDCVHIVAAGQNLFRIGLQYNMSYITLANYNGIANPALIRVGQEIRIPNCGVGQPAPGTVPSTGTGSTESGSFPGTGTGSGVGTTGSTCGPSIVVEQYDTLFAISLRCNVLIRDIQSLNGIVNPDLIYFNSTLRLQ
ncbi:MAG: LysM peptidoglycan-binding domain-containing protein [Chloroflexi bacterium]|nr:LysM peptidoglycan-binding domain-containing protein [Chloroflexota bacterium]